MNKVHYVLDQKQRNTSELSTDALEQSHSATIETTPPVEALDSIREMNGM